MEEPAVNPSLRAEACLCSECIHARRVESSRGSVFLLCELSTTDARFPKYPRLPVLSCSGFRSRGEAVPVQP